MEPVATSPPPCSRESPHCPNCGAATEGDRFCPDCGQRQRAFRQPVHVLARDLVAEYFGFEGKLWQTALALLRPGFLTAEYLDGRQRRYARPLRLYLVASLLFFFAVSLIDPGEQLRRTILDGGFTSETTVEEALEASAEQQQRLRARRAALDRLSEAGVVLVPDSLLEDVAEPDTARALVIAGRAVESELVREIGRIESRADAAAVLPRVVQSAVARVPNAMFVLLPMFAFLLKLLYARRGRYYGEHLVFAFHVHAFWFGCFTLALVLGALIGDVPGIRIVSEGDGASAGGWRGAVSSAVAGGIGVGLPLYTVLALRRVYGQGWGKTLVKAWALSWSYAVVLVLGMAGVLALTLVW